MNSLDGRSLLYIHTGDDCGDTRVGQTVWSHDGKRCAPLVGCSPSVWLGNLGIDLFFVFVDADVVSVARIDGISLRFARVEKNCLSAPPIGEL